MPNRSWDERLAEVERMIGEEKRARQQLQNEVKPIVDFYNAGSLIGKVLWILGGLIVGAATVWAAISGWVTSHK